MKGVPLRLEVGPKDIENGQVILARRDTGEKLVIALEELENKISEILADIQNNLFQKAKKHREERTTVSTSLTDLKETLETKPGYVKAMWCGDRACEDRVKEETGATSRCIPFEQEAVSDNCLCCGKEASQMVYWAKAY
jgi:prolyl-tRNA synthetase